MRQVADYRVAQIEWIMHLQSASAWRRFPVFPACAGNAGSRWRSNRLIPAYGWFIAT
jgi:hypothetical protein